MRDLIRQAIPAFFGLLATEYAAAKALGRDDSFDHRDTVTSLSMGVINVLLEAVQAPASHRLYQAIYDRRLMDFPLQGAPRGVALLLLEDLCYYWFHRSHHEVRMLWAAHVNHHSSEKYNLSTALRQSWATPWTKLPFWMPLAWIGFTPDEIKRASSINLLYQFWIHTELIDDLGPLEEVLSTPSHHRAHHGSNLAYLDTNYGGIFIIWDRLFGTFAREDREQDPVRYGLIKNIESFDLLEAEFHEAKAILQDIRDRGGLKAAVETLLRPPGWRPGDDSDTVAGLKRAAKSAA